MDSRYGGTFRPSTSSLTGENVKSLEQFLFGDVSDSETSYAEPEITTRIVEEPPCVSESEDEEKRTQKKPVLTTNEPESSDEKIYYEKNLKREKTHCSEKNTLPKIKSVRSVWIDKDDEQSDYIDIMRYAKLRKLRRFQNDSKEKNHKVISTQMLSGTEFQDRLKKFHETRTGSLDWANTLRKKRPQLSTDEDDPLCLSSKNFLTSVNPIILPEAQRTLLPSGNLKYMAFRDTNKSDPSESAVLCCDFVPATRLVYTAGRDKTLRLYEGVGSRNPRLLKKIHFESSRIKSCVPVYDPTNVPKVLGISGKYSLFEVDIPTTTVSVVPRFKLGQRTPQLHHIAASGSKNLFSVLADDGYIFVGDLRMKGIAQKFKMNSLGRCLDMKSDFNDNTIMFTGDNEGKVYLWDLKLNRCHSSFQNIGSYLVTAVKVSDCLSYLAVGCSSGMVNLYNIKSHGLVVPSPLSTSFEDTLDCVKIFGNLTSAVTSLKFNHNTEILATASSFMREGVKLLHLKSMTAYRNFPRQDHSLNLMYPTALAFSDKSDLFLVGNSHGAVKTFSLPHYKILTFS